MSPVVSVVPATESHVNALSLRLREADVREVVRLGDEPLTAVAGSWRRSPVCRAALVNGTVAAMWGAAGTPMGFVGQPWLLTAPACELVSSLTFARIYCREARGMLALFPKLENYVDASYDGAVRLLQLAGFTLDEAKPYGPTRSLFRRFVMGVA